MHARLTQVGDGAISRDLHAVAYSKLLLCAKLDCDVTKGNSKKVTFEELA
jgi:hypothetical protein